jgi:hypothetical protein
MWMLDRFAQFTSLPTSIQFAKEGVWESAWSPPIDQLPLRQDLVSYLALSTEVAFEAFFGDSFFGARMTGSPQEVETFSIQCIRAVRARESFFPVFQQEIGCPVRSQQPDFADIGCVNAWRSVGAFHISEFQASSAEFEQLWHSLQECAVGQDTRHAKAIEFAFERPVPHWFGVPVSIPGESHRLSEGLLCKALGLRN